MNNNIDSKLEAKIKARLSTLKPEFLEITDESHLHHGHPGVKEHGGRHYALEIKSAAFTDLTLIKRHQLIYTLLADLLKKEIHALKINAKT